MEKINYQKKMEAQIAALDGVPTLLLHSCCGPCSSAVLETLSRHFEVTILYYNPNIYPEAEYEKRLAEQKKLLEKMPFAHPVHLMECAYDAERFEQAAKGLEDAPEGGARCTACFRLRLEKTAALAKENGFSFFTTTLSVSPHKNAPLLNKIGEEFAKQYGVAYLYADFKKKDGYKRSIALSREYDLYRQDYCGCRFSVRKGKEEE